MEDEGIIIPTKVPTPPSRSHSTTVPPSFPHMYSATSYHTNPFNQSGGNTNTFNVPTVTYASQTSSDGPQRKRSIMEAPPTFEKSISSEFVNTFPVSSLI